MAEPWGIAGHKAEEIRGTLVAERGGIKCTNTHIIGVPEGEEQEKGPEKVFEEKIAEKFPNMGKKIVNQVQEAQSPKKDKPKEKHKIHSNQTDKHMKIKY